jgi:hypothetical protein
MPITEISRREKPVARKPTCTSGFDPSRTFDNVRFRAAIWGIADVIKRLEL